MPTPVSRIPPPRQVLADQQGLMSAPWYRYLAQFQQSVSIIEAGSGLAFTGNILGIANNGVTNALLRQGAAASVIGRRVASTGNVADITATSNRTVLGRQNDALGFYDIAAVRRVDTQVLVVGVRSVTANASFGLTDYLIVADATSGAITLTLPALEEGRVVVAKKLDSSGNTVTVSGAANIDGAASEVISTQYASVTLIGGATEWHIA